MAAASSAAGAAAVSRRMASTAPGPWAWPGSKPDADRAKPDSSTPVPPAILRMNVKAPV